MQLEIMIQCVGIEYTKRLNWMLSSILQQEDIDSSDNLIINISYWNNPVEQKLIDTITYFRIRGLHIKEVKFTERKLACSRNDARNEQVKDSTADWILFADCDMVYDKLFFSDLFSQIKNALRDVVICISASRISLDIDYCTEYFNGIDLSVYPIEIKDVASNVSSWPVYQKASRVAGAGYMQLVNRKVLVEKGNIYSKKIRKEPLGFYTSDMAFRAMLSLTGSKYDVFAIETKSQYHLNHKRNK